MLRVRQLKNSTRQVPQILERLVAKTLDPDLCAIIRSPPDENWLLESSLQVLQLDTLSASVTRNSVISLSSAPVVAVVDRSANFDEAAKALVQARFAFSGQSPYAPDIVLANEFVRQDFLQAVVRETIATEKSRTERGSKSLGENKSEKAAELQEKQGAKLVTQSIRGSVIDIPTRSPSLLRKTSSPILRVHAMSSLEDCINFIER